MKTLLLSALAIGSVVAIPAVSFAATYAYVNTSGEVMTTDAATAQSALLTAPNIGVHSGVMLMDGSDASQQVVGDSVSGV